MIGWEKQFIFIKPINIDILVRLEPRRESIVARNTWWNEIVKSKNERTKRAFFMFSSMFSLFQRENCENNADPSSQRRYLIFLVYNFW